MSIQIKRGMKKDLPQLKDGELAFCKDTKELYVGNNGNENVSITKKIEDRLDAVDSQLEQSVYHIQNIKTEKFRDTKSGTTYYITEIKRIDVDGEIIKPKLGIANDSYNNGILETCRDFGKRHNATAVFNGGFFNMDNNTINTLFIKDGIILNNGEYKNPNTNRILVWNDEGFLSQVETRYSANEILAMGYTNALCGAVCLLDKGKPVTTGSSIGNPHQVIAQRENGDIIFLTSLGRLDNEPGMSYNDFIRILQSYNVTFAYSLDGGGSVSSVVNGVKINENIDDNGYTDRPVVNFIYFEKEKKVNKTTDITNIHSMIGDLDQHIKKVVLDVLNKNTINNRVLNLKSDESNAFIIKNYLNDEHVGSFGMSDEKIYYYDMVKGETRFEVDNNGQIFTPKGSIGRFNNTPFSINTVEELDNLKESGMFWVVAKIGNTIGNHSIAHGLISFYVSDNARMQIAFPFDERTVSKARFRRTNGSSWYPWIDL